jgi:hypothetical protein
MDIPRIEPIQLVRNARGIFIDDEGKELTICPFRDDVEIKDSSCQACRYYIGQTRHLNNCIECVLIAERP